MLTDYKAEINNMNTQKHHLINILFLFLKISVIITIFILIYLGSGWCVTRLVFAF